MSQTHRWAVALFYELGDEDATTVSTGGEIHVEEEQRLGITGPYCLNCEVHKLDADEDCTGELFVDSEQEDWNRGKAT